MANELVQVMLPNGFWCDRSNKFVSIGPFVGQTAVPDDKRTARGEPLLDGVDLTDNSSEHREGVLHLITPRADLPRTSGSIVEINRFDVRVIELVHPDQHAGMSDNRRLHGVSRE